MPTRRATRRRVGNAPARVLAALGGVVAFLGIASLIEPSHVPAAFEWHPNSSATTGLNRTGSTPGVSPAHGSLLLTLVGVSYTVEVYSGNPDPVFTVIDTAGNIVADRIPKDEIYRIDPQLDVDSMMGSAMGLVEDCDF